MNAMPGAVAQQSLRHGLRRALQLLERLGHVHGGVVLRPEPVLVDAERGVHAPLRLLHLSKVLVQQAWLGLG